MFRFVLVFCLFSAVNCQTGITNSPSALVWKTISIDTNAVASTSCPGVCATLAANAAGDDGHMASLLSNAERDALVALLSNNQEVWIAGRRETAGGDATTVTWNDCSDDTTWIASSTDWKAGHPDGDGDSGVKFKHKTAGNEMKDEDETNSEWCACAKDEVTRVALADVTNYAETSFTKDVVKGGTFNMEIHVVDNDHDTVTDYGGNDIDIAVTGSASGAGTYSFASGVSSLAIVGAAGIVESVTVSMAATGVCSLYDISQTWTVNFLEPFTVTPSTGLTTTEAGGAATFDVVLNVAPESGQTVQIPISSDSTDEGTVSHTTVTFTDANWNLPQTVTITGVDDDIDDDNAGYTIVLGACISGDANYNGEDSSLDVSVTNSDDDTAGITVNPTSGLSVAEVGLTNATFTVVLDSEPTDDVTIGITSSDAGEGTVTPASLIFTDLNWNSAQTVTITAVDDAITDTDQAFTITTAAAVSTDGKYSGLNPSDVSVTNIAAAYLWASYFAPAQSASVPQTLSTIDIQFGWGSGWLVYCIADQNAAAPSEAQIKSGLEQGNSPADAAGNVASTGANVDSALQFSSLSPGTTYNIYCVAEELPSASNFGDVSTVLTISTADDWAASIAQATNGPTSSTIEIQWDIASGYDVFCIADPTPGTPTETDIIAGVIDDSATAAASSPASTASTGSVQDTGMSFTSLTPLTSYEIHCVAQLTATPGVYSSIATVTISTLAGFTMNPTVATTDGIFATQIAIQFDHPIGYTIYCVADADAGPPSNAQVKAGDNSLNAGAAATGTIGSTGSVQDPAITFSTLSQGVSYHIFCVGEQDSSPGTFSQIAPDLIVTTLVAATAPTGINLNNPSLSTLDLSWTAGTVNDCTFSNWTVVMSPGSFVPDGCTTNDLTLRGTTSCTATGLAPGVSYTYTVQENCIITDTNSPGSVSSGAVATLEQANSPTAVAASNPSGTTLDVSWTAGAPNDCTWSYWHVVIHPGGNEPPGCTESDLNGARGTTSCTATGLNVSTAYEFVVYEVCTDATFNSANSTASALVQTLTPAFSPFAVTPGNAGTTTMDLSWNDGIPNDCVFSHWDVQFVAGDLVGQPTGCTTGDLGVRGTTSCSITGLSTATVYSFSVSEVCTDTDLSSGVSLTSSTLSTLAPAETPINLAGSAPTATTMFLNWDSQSAFSCVFSHWEVLIVVPAGPSVPTGCGPGDMTDRSVTNCTITGLTSNTNYEYTIQEKCTNPVYDSGTSANSAPVLTLTPATAPTGVSANNPTVSSMDISWTDGAANGCIFSHWEVIASPGGTVPTGCTAGDLAARGTTSCTATGLTANTEFNFTVAEVCTLFDMASVPSVPSNQERTLAPASPPTAVTGGGAPVTATSFSLNWIAGQSNDCVFARWHVVMLPGGNEPTGCTESDLNVARSTTSCVLTGLTPGVFYTFYVSEICTDSQFDSANSTASAPTSTLIPAAAVTGVATSNPGTSSMDLVWSASAPNDCVFASWDVQFVAGDLVGQPTGCTSADVSTRGSTSCSITGLSSATYYSFSIQEVCTISSLSSSLVTSTSASTLAAAETPINLAGSDPTATTVLVSWDAQLPFTCVFSHWEVLQVVPVGPTIPTGCSPGIMTDRTVTNCTVTGLVSNTNYEYTIQERCTSPVYDSPVSANSPPVTTLIPATASTGVAASNPSASSLDISWVAGSPNGCSFSHWSVIISPGGFEPTGCTSSDLNARGTLSCTATGLSDGVFYTFTVQEICTASDLDAPLSTASISVSTLTKASPPTSLVVGGSTRTALEMDLTWSAGLSNDCTWSAWRVVLFPGGNEPTGCAQSDLAARGTTTCVLTGLTPSTSYQFSVSEICTDAQFNSVNSTISLAQSTLTPASDPTGVVPFNAGLTFMDLSWTPGPANDCVFAYWNVSFIVGDLSGQPTGCTRSDLTTRTPASCSMTGLTSAVFYSFKVQEVCTDATVNSQYSSSSASLSTLAPAQTPTNLVSSTATATTMFVEWDSQIPFSCVFAYWEMLIVVPAGPSVPANCGPGDMTDRSVTNCTVTGLIPTTNYEFTVQEKCTNALYESPVSANSPTFATTTPATAPSGVTPSNPTLTTVDVSWTDGSANDCVFSYWEVVVFPGGTSPTGCLSSDLSARGTTSCTASGLAIDTSYSFTVREACVAPDNSSPDSVISGSIFTHDTADNPVVIGEDYSPTQINVSWTPGAPNNCVFASWNVLVFPGGSTPTGCTGLTSRGVRNCVATGLSQNIAYQFDVFEVCTDTDYDSVAGTATNVYTQMPAAVPTTLPSNPNPATIVFRWSPGQAFSCDFSYWEVVLASGDMTGTPVGCTGLTSRSSSSCSASGLTAGVLYTFNVTEICTDPTWNSPQGGPSTPAELSDLFIPLISSTKNPTTSTVTIELSVKLGYNVYCTADSRELLYGHSPTMFEISQAKIAGGVINADAFNQTISTGQIMTEAITFYNLEADTDYYIFCATKTLGSVLMDGKVSDEMTVIRTLADFAILPQPVLYTDSSDTVAAKITFPRNYEINCIVDNSSIPAGLSNILAGKSSPTTNAFWFGAYNSTGADEILYISGVDIWTTYYIQCSAFSLLYQAHVDVSVPVALTPFIPSVIWFNPIVLTEQNWLMSFSGTALPKSKVYYVVTDQVNNVTAANLTSVVQGNVVDDGTGCYGSTDAGTGVNGDYLVNVECILPSATAFHISFAIDDDGMAGNLFGASYDIFSPARRVMNISFGEQPAIFDYNYEYNKLNSKLEIDLSHAISGTNLQYVVLTVPEVGQLIEPSAVWFDLEGRSAESYDSTANGVDIVSAYILRESRLIFRSSIAFEMISFHFRASDEKGSRTGRIVITCELTQLKAPTPGLEAAFSFGYGSTFTGVQFLDVGFGGFHGLAIPTNFESVDRFSRWFFDFSADYLENQAFSYGGKLQFSLVLLVGDLSNDNLRSDLDVLEFIRIECASCDNDNGLSMSSFGIEWDGQEKQFSFSMVETDNWMLDPGDRTKRDSWRKPSVCEMLEILSSISRIQVFPDVTEGSEQVGIGGVEFLAGDVLPATCVF